MNKRRQKFERLKALLSLAATQQEWESSETLSHEQLTQFIKGQASKAERKAVLRSLRTCPAAYRKWMAMEDVLCALQPAVTEPKQAFFSWRRLTGALDFIHAWRTLPSISSRWAESVATAQINSGILTTSRARWAVSVATAALVMVVAFSLLPSPTSPFNEMELRIAQYVEHDKQLGDKLIQLRSPPTQQYGFSAQTTNVSPAEQAFSAGVLLSQQKVLGWPEVEKANWRQTQWSAYFELGRWIFLNWAIAQSGKTQPAEFWREQANILADVQSKIGIQSPIPGLSQDLAELRTRINQLAELEDPLIGYPKLKYATGELLNIMSPVSNAYEP